MLLTGGKGVQRKLTRKVYANSMHRFDRNGRELKVASLILTLHIVFAFNFDASAWSNAYCLFLSRMVQVHSEKLRLNKP